MKNLINYHLKNTICWSVSHSCNLNCSFCEIPKNPILIKKEIEFLKQNWNSYKAGFKNLKGQWEIYLLGGEPLSIPHILDYIKDLINMGHKISISTNFSYSTEFYKKFLKIVDKNLCLFHASFKLEYYNFESYLKKAKIIDALVKKQDGFFGIGAVATVKDIDLLYDIGLKFRKEDINFNLQAQKKDYKYINYSKNEKEKIIKFQRNFGLNKNNVFKNKLCKSGINFFVLDSFGDAYRCHTSKQMKTNYMGNMIKKTFKLYENTKKCNNKECLCIMASNKNLRE